MSLRPWYNQEANYQTNAKSFMDYLGRTNKFLEVLIEDYDNFQELVIAELERIKFDSEMAVDDILVNWLDDGTLARIINDGVLGNKADTSYVESELQKISDDVDLKHNQLTTNVINLNNETINMIDNIYKLITPEMTTAEIQTELNNGGSFKFAEGVFKFDVPDDYDPYILNIESNTTIVFDKKTVIELKDHNALRYKILFIKDKKNVTLINPTIDGRRDLNTATTGEWGMGISIVGSENINIYDATIKNCWGDGIYIGRVGSNTTKSTNIVLENVVCDNNRRQGISVISVNGLYGKNVTLKNTNGTAPEAGIDFEPNFAEEELDNIYFDGLKLYNNNGNGLMFYLNNLTNHNYKMNMSFNQVEAIGNKQAGVSFLRFIGSAKGSIRFIDPYIKESGSKGIYIRGVSKNFARLIFDHPTIVNNNTTKTGGATQGASITVLRSSSDYVNDPTFKMGNFEVNNPLFLNENNFTRYGSYFSIFDQMNDDLDVFENIVIDGIQDRSFTNRLGLLNDTNKFINTSLSEYNYWPGTTPVTQNFPRADELVDEVGFTTKTSIAQLVQSNSKDLAKEITFRVDISADYRQTIRPPANEYLYPRSLTSNTLGRGITTSDSGSDNVGSHVTLKRIKNKWVITDIVGNWTAET